MKTSRSDPALSEPLVPRLWRRVPLAIRASIIGLTVALIGTLTWTALLVAVPLPWPIVAMTVFLLLYWQYFRGRWWPKATADVRATSFRSTDLTPDVWKWGLIAAVSIALLVNASIVVTFRLVEFPGETLDIGIQTDSNPLWMTWLAIIMAAVVAGVVEEIGFRGYMQVPLELHYGPFVAIAITTIMFVLTHLNQAWVGALLIQLVLLSVLTGVLAYAARSLIPGMIGHTLLDIFAFSYWWSDVLGSFDWRPISETGIDAHSMLWTALLVISFICFIWATRNVAASSHR